MGIIKEYVHITQEKNLTIRALGRDWIASFWDLPPATLDLSCLVFEFDLCLFPVCSLPFDGLASQRDGASVTGFLFFPSGCDRFRKSFGSIRPANGLPWLAGLALGLVAAEVVVVWTWLVDDGRMRCDDVADSWRLFWYRVQRVSMTQLEFLKLLSSHWL